MTFKLKRRLNHLFSKKINKIINKNLNEIPIQVPLQGGAYSPCHLHSPKPKYSFSPLSFPNPF